MINKKLNRLERNVERSRADLFVAIRYGNTNTIKKYNQTYQDTSNELKEYIQTHKTRNIIRRR